MKIKVTDHYSKETQVRDLSYYITRRMEELSHGHGVVEEVSNRTDYISSYVARLLEILVEHKALTLDEIRDILQTEDTLEE